MKMRGDDCLRRAGKRNLGRGRKESLRGVDGGARKGAYDSPTCRSRKRETDVAVERDNLPFFHALWNIQSMCY